MRNIKFFFVFLFTILLAVSSCRLPADATTNSSPANNPSTSAAAAGAAAAAPTVNPNTVAKPDGCYKVDVGEKKILRTQTFAIDFEPFRGSCFVTSHEPEFTDPPLDSEIAIYRDGKKLSAFREISDTGKSIGDEDATGIPTNGCWIEAVAFQDINADSLTDAIVVAKCGTKGGPYNENAVYINNGKFLVNRRDSSLKLSDLKSVKEIVQFTKEKPQLFSLTVDAAPNNR